VWLEGSTDEAHGRGAGAVTLETLDSRPHHLGVPGESEIVVRREDDHLAAALHLDDGALRGLQRQEALVRLRVAQRVELGAQVAVETRAHPGTPFGRRTILQASPDSRSAKASS